MDPDPASRHLLKISLFGTLCILFSCSRTDNDSLSLKDTVSKNPDLPKTRMEQFITTDTTGKRTLYLTFDDGPNNGTTTVLNILKAEQVPATFFIIGIHVKELPASKIAMPVLRSLPNILLCNHSYTHGYKNQFDRFYQDVHGAVKDFQRCRDSNLFSNNIARAPGNNIWRTPHYNQTTYERYKPTANMLYDSGFILLGWDTEWRYKSRKLRQTIVQMEREIDNMYTHNKNHYPGHCVLLMHDITFTDPKDSMQLHQLIHHFKNDTSYRFDIVTNHPFVKP